MYPDDFLQKKLDERRENQSLRQLRLPNGKTDFSSNDYLGIVRNNLLTQPQTPNPKPLTPNP
jgi:8-amino-7-oxononanoate synthase